MKQIFLMIDFTSLELSLKQFETTLDGLFDQMLGLSKSFIGLGQIIGCIGALLFISSKVWGHLARAEPIDVFPLLRPFAIGLCILMFPQLAGSLRGITLAISHSTDDVRNKQTADLLALTKKKEETKPPAATVALDAAKSAALALMDPGGALADAGVSLAGSVLREVLTDFLSLAAIVARLALYLISTLLLTLLCVAGPFAFGIAILPGFGGGIVKWFGNFITISMWVPVANMFAMALGQLQIMLLNNAIAAQTAGNSTDATDTGLLVFLALSTLAYVMVPKAAEMLVSAAGVGGSSGAAATVLSPVTTIAGAAGGVAGAGVRGVAGGAMGVSPQPGSILGNLGNRLGQNMRSRP